MSGKVYVIKKDLSFFILGTVIPNQPVEVTRRSHVGSVNDVNKKMLDLLYNDSHVGRLNIKERRPVVADDIKSHLVSILHFRRCTVLVSLQISDRSVKVIPYVYSFCFHDGGSFGTTAEPVLGDPKGNIFDNLVRKYHTRELDHLPKGLQNIFGSSDTIISHMLT